MLSDWDKRVRRPIPRPYSLPKPRWPKRAGIYSITDPATEARYIGATQRLNIRRAQHGSVLRKNCGHRALQDAFDANMGNLKCEVLVNRRI